MFGGLNLTGAVTPVKQDSEKSPWSEEGSALDVSPFPDRAEDSECPSPEKQMKEVPTKQTLIEPQGRHFLRNLTIAIVSQISVLFNYYLLAYMVTFFTQIYSTAIFAGCAELLGYAFSGWLLPKFGLRSSFLISTAITSVGGLAILVYGYEHQDSPFFPVMFLIAKMGNASMFNISWASGTILFDVRIAARVMGAMNFFARAFCSLAPLVSTLPQPLPIIVFCISTIASGIMTIWVKEPPMPARPKITRPSNQVAPLDKLEAVGKLEIVDMLEVIDV